MDLKTFQLYASEAPALLDQISLLLQECQDRELLLPEGIRNLCDLSWEELCALPPDARPLHQPVRGSDRAPPRPPHPAAPGPLPPDARRRMSIVSSQTLLPPPPPPAAAESVACLRQPVVPPGAVRIRKRASADRENTGTCVPVSSTLRLHREEGLYHLSFSLAYRGSSSAPPVTRLPMKTLEVLYWAVTKLRPIVDLIEEERARLEEGGHTRPLVTQHYPDYRSRPAPSQAPPPAGDALFPVIPSTKQLSHSLALKRHYGLTDGSCCLYYPSGSLAVCQIPAPWPRPPGGGGAYTNVFSEGPVASGDAVLLASFTPCGRGFVSHAGKPRSSWFSLVLVGGVGGTAGGRQYTRDGGLAKEWTRNARGQSEVAHRMTVNENVSLTFSGDVSLQFTVLTETITLSVTQECWIPAPWPRPPGGGGAYTNVFSEGPVASGDAVLLASFTPCGRGFVSHAGKPRSSWFSLVLVGGVGGTAGGRQYTRDGGLAKEWTRNARGQSEVAHRMTVNENVSLTFSGDVSLQFTVLTETITLSVTQECWLSGGAAEVPVATGVESAEAELEVYRVELRGIRKRVRNTALRWLHFYLVNTGLGRDEAVFPVPKPRPLKRKQAWTSTPRMPLVVEECLPAFVRPAPLRRRTAARPVTCSPPVSRPAHLFRPASHRAKSAALPRVSSLSALPSPPPPSPCPVALRRLLLLRRHDYEGRVCRCSTRLPVLSDLELGLFLRSPWSPRGHVLVVYVSSSLRPPAGARGVEAELQRVHHGRVHASANPCAKSSQDPFRLVKYDLDQANQLTQTPLPLLVQRHGVGPGTLLMYAGGRLLFGGSALDGYGFSKVNLLRQIARAQRDFNKGHFLPKDFLLGGWRERTPAQREGPDQGRGQGRGQNRPPLLRSRSSCSHRRENRLLHRPPPRSEGGSSLDFVVSSMSDRASVLAMRSDARLSPRHARTSTPSPDLTL